MEKNTENQNGIRERRCPFLQDIVTDARQVNTKTLEEIIILCLEIAREGREGRKVGTLMVVGDEKQTMQESRCLILDPLSGHPQKDRLVTSSNMRETAKELAQLDGGFIVSDAGYFLSACRYFNAAHTGIDFPLGLGTRHLAGASISGRTGAVSVVVSESSIVRIFDNGEIISEIYPELWLMSRYSLHMTGPCSTRKANDMAAVYKK